MVYGDEAKVEDALENVMRGDLLRHLIYIPPRCMQKTSISGKQLQDKDLATFKRRCADVAPKHARHASQIVKCKYGEACKFAASGATAGPDGFDDGKLIGVEGITEADSACALDGSELQSQLTILRKLHYC